MVYVTLMGGWVLGNNTDWEGGGGWKFGVHFFLFLKLVKGLPNSDICSG